MRAIFREVDRSFRVTCVVTLLFASAGGVRCEAQVVRPTNHLARARAYLDAGRVDLAEEFARRATEANEENGEAYLLLGTLLARRGDGEMAVRALARARTLRPEDPVAREQLARALRGGFPTGIGDGLFRSLPGEAVRGEIELRDPRLGLAAPESRGYAVLVAEERDTAAARDPKYRRPYSRVAHSYVLQQRPTRWFRVATVRFQSAAEAKLARRVGTVLAQLFWMRREYVGAAPDFPRPPESTVWLARDGRAGGEEWNGEIYLYEVGRTRSAEEWVREVVHEYGHVALPGTPRYSAPEPKANGYLGERLLATWLWRNRATVWDGEVDLARYVARRAVPLRRQFLDQGPTSPLRSRRDAAGMDHYIGAVLAWEATYGPTLLRAALSRAGSEGADGFLRACQRVLTTSGARSFEIGGEALLTATGAVSRRAVWLYLPVGRWKLELETGATGSPEARWDGRPLALSTARPCPAFMLHASAAGWHRLELAMERGPLRRLALVRAEEPPVGRGRGLSGRGQHLTQATERLSLQARDVHLRDSEGLSDLGLGEFFKETKVDNLPLASFEASDHLRERPALLDLRDIRILRADEVRDDPRAPFRDREMAVE